MEFEGSAMRFVFLFFLQWMFVFQQFYMATFASRTHRIMKFFQFEYVLDAVTLLILWAYLVIILRDWRYDTFLKTMGPEEEAQLFWK
jgi:hypothetical protein